jgi:cadmium resistance protein CadD (predicted permease)
MTTLCFAAAVFCATKIVVTLLRSLIFENATEAAQKLKSIWTGIFIGVAILTCAAYYAAHHPLS